MKRFYKDVQVVETASGYEIHLDGRPVKTSNKKPVITKFKTVAEEMKAEWQAQEEKIVPDTMPMTQIITTQIDRGHDSRHKLTETLLKYVDTDLICYGVEKPEQLRDEQEKQWMKWREWAAEQYDVKIDTTHALHAIKQDQKLHEGISKTLNGLCDDRFAIVQTVAPITGSVILTLAFVEGKAITDDLMNAIFVEENYKEKLYNAEKYGNDPLIEQNKKAAFQDLKACTIYRDAISNA